MTDTGPSKFVATVPTREFRLAAECRRAGWWGIIGLVLLAPVGWYSFAIVEQRGVVDQAIIVTAFLGGAVWNSQYLLVRVRLDPEGVHKRVLWWWDVWSWKEFGSGTIKEGYYAGEFISLVRPWWRRKFHVGYLEDSDAAAIKELIRQAWVLPPLEDVPETLAVKLNWPDRRLLEISPHGLTVKKRQTKNAYRWDEVDSIRIWRIEAGRRDFHELELSLPDQKIRFHRYRTEQGVECQSWSKCSPEVLACALCRHVEAVRIFDFALEGTVRNLDELEARHTRQSLKCAQSLTVFQWTGCAVWLMMAVVMVTFAWPANLAMAAVTMAVAALGYWLYRDTIRAVQDQEDEYRRERQRLEVEPQLSEPRLHELL